MQIVLKEEEEKEKKETKTGGVLLDSACGCCKNECVIFFRTEEVYLQTAETGALHDAQQQQIILL